MSVLIKGMKMPHRCSDCNFYNADYCMQNNIGRRECAIVELPEKHGRLIDADALKDTLDYYIREAGWSEEINKALRWVKDEFIDSEQAIIEAEGD